MWWDLAQNPRVVLAYYNAPPQLCGVEVHSVLFHRDGPSLELLVEMPCFPDKPSPRWPAGANTAQARLRLFDLREVSLAGWSTTNIGNLWVETKDGAVRLQFDCPTAQLTCIAGYFDVADITGHIKETPNKPMHPSGGSAAS